MIKFKSDQTELKLNSILNCIIQSHDKLYNNFLSGSHKDNKYFSYDDSDINALSSVFNIPKSDIKKIYDNFFTLIN